MIRLRILIVLLYLYMYIYMYMCIYICIYIYVYIYILASWKVPSRCRNLTMLHAKAVFGLGVELRVFDALHDYVMLQMHLHSTILK